VLAKMYDRHPPLLPLIGIGGKQNKRIRIPLCVIAFLPVQR